MTYIPLERESIAVIKHVPDSQQDLLCSVIQLCTTLCDPMDCSRPGFPVLHHLLELAQIHVHRVSDSIQLSHPLLSPSSLRDRPFSLSQHKHLF